MDYSKIGRDLAGIALIDMDQLIMKIEKEHYESFQEKRINIQLNLLGQGVMLQGNEGHFYTVINNLVLNARDALFDPANIGKEKSVIEITSEIVNSFYRLHVNDNGIGIPEEHISKIYDAFFSSKPESGTGLGLSFVQKSVLLYNGTIDVRSEYGIGTSFIVNFPMKTD